MFKDEGKNDTWRTIANGILKKFDDKHQKFIQSLDERFAREEALKNLDFYGKRPQTSQPETLTLKKKKIKGKRKMSVRASISSELH